MTEITLTDARDRLAFVVDQSRREPVYLTRGNVRVAVVVDTDSLARLLSDAEELADIRAVDAAWDETDRLGETPIPWKDVTREVGL
ncbi:type II toxin-antitoxin system Phd/YefM family antitoxin [Microbacterium sp. A93]|uniref:type II toxin-antitoxin system Phd/YefM family antitoxin n=1 Tax=Microbacterium sp. A93 TaxID=3450716 RepID=UPI003F41BF55